MGGGESTNSTASQSRPLTAAERQDIYNASVGNIKNIYTQSGLPYDGSGSMDYAAASYDGNTNKAGTGVANKSYANGTLSGTQYYDAKGNATSSGGNHGSVTLDPKTYFQAENPNIKMPTGGANPGGVNFPTYQSPDYQSPGSYKGLSDGDYGNLFKSMMLGNISGLDYAKKQDIENLDNSMAKRGLWSSGLVDQNIIKDINTRYAPQYAQAGANATQQAYAAKQNDLSQRNQYNLNASNAANSFNQQQQGQKFTAGWAPLNYLANLWNGTTGQVSGSNQFGQSLDFKI